MWYNVYAQEYKINEKGVLETMSGKATRHDMDILTVLQIIFIVLKVIGAINWSWWAVFIPLWIDIALLLLVYWYYS